MSCFRKNSSEDMRHKASGGKIWGNANFQLLLSFANASNIFASDQIVVVIFSVKSEASIYFIINQPGKRRYVRTLFQNSIIHNDVVQKRQLKTLITRIPHYFYKQLIDGANSLY